MGTEIYDSRDRLDHEIGTGQVYGHTRHESNGGYEEHLRIVYCDDERVLLRSSEKTQTGRYSGSTRYVIEHRHAFEEKAGEGFYTLIDDPDDPPRMPTDGIAAALNSLKRLRDAAKHRVECGAGKRGKHRFEAFKESVDAVDSLRPEPVDWGRVDGIGPSTAQNLRDAGFDTAPDILAVEDDQVLNVDGIGPKSLQKIRDELRDR